MERFLDINQIVFIVIFSISFVIGIITLYKVGQGKKMNERLPWLIIPGIISIFAGIDKAINVYLPIDAILIAFYVCVFTNIYKKIKRFINGN